MKFRLLGRGKPLAEAKGTVVLPDGGRGYLAKIFSDRWMASYGFVGGDSAATAADGCQTGAQT